MVIMGRYLTMQHVLIMLTTKSFIGNENFINIYRIQAYDSIMIGYFCSGFIDFILKGKSLTDFANLFYVLTK